jgi:hypothetical protein
VRGATFRFTIRDLLTLLAIGVTLPSCNGRIETLKEGAKHFDQRAKDIDKAAQMVEKPEPDPAP